MTIRPAEKAGSWYVADPQELEGQLNSYLGSVPKTIDGSSTPISGARIIIAPHAGFDYSGACAAWAYSILDLSKAKRVFLLGPSHTYYLTGCAVTTFAKYDTPFGPLTVDEATVQSIKQAGQFASISLRNDVAEHSLEMHTPYIYKRFKQTFGTPDKFPSIVPVLVGNGNSSQEKATARMFAPYMKDPENAFIISSDFCHWGCNFSYTPYSAESDPSKLIHLRPRDPTPVGVPIHETIKMLDEAAMDALTDGSHDKFLDNLKLTGNTVCGRHPIGVAMAALEQIREENESEEGKFRVVRYERSNLVKRPSEMSVSYVSAYAIL